MNPKTLAGSFVSSREAERDRRSPHRELGLERAGLSAVRNAFDRSRARHAIALQKLNRSRKRFLFLGRRRSYSKHN